MSEAQSHKCECIQWHLCDEEMPPTQTMETEDELILCEAYSGRITIMHLPQANGNWWDTEGSLYHVDGNRLRPRFKHPFYAWARLNRLGRVE